MRRVCSIYIVLNYVFFPDNAFKVGVCVVVFHIVRDVLGNRYCDERVTSVVYSIVVMCHTSRVDDDIVSWVFATAAVLRVSGLARVCDLCGGEGFVFHNGVGLVMRFIGWLLFVTPPTDTEPY